MPFEKIKSVSNKNTRRKRITQRDLIPKAVKLRNSEIYQLGEETIIIYDKDSEEVLKVNQTDNKVEFGDNAWVNYSDGSASFSSVTAPEGVGEYWLQVSPQWQYANNTAYVDVDGSLVQVNFDDLSNKTVYFEVTGKTDAGTGTYQLYNITDAAAFAGSELSTASTSAVLMRSSALTIPTGTKSVKVQYKCVGGDGSTEYVNCIVAKLIVRSS